MPVLALSPAEFFHLWPTPPGPLADQVLARNADAVILALYTPDLADPHQKQLIGYWPIWQAVHIDGIWIDEAVKAADPGALRSLLEAAFATLQANGVTLAFAMLADDADSLAQAQRLGFVRAPGNLYTLKV